jgi:outer membrane protein OmpA-like peptidoglycan-associated protein
LSKQAKDALDQIAAQLKGQRGYILEVQGFSSGRGQAAITNSRRVADAVVRYMVQNHEIPAYRMYVLGLGNASEEKHASGSRVEVSVMKNDLDQTAKP